MSWAHINMLGEYDFSEEKLRDTLGILPPKKAAYNQCKNGGCKNKKNPVNPISYRKRYVGFRTFMLRNPTFQTDLIRLSSHKGEIMRRVNMWGNRTKRDKPLSYDYVLVSHPTEYVLSPTALHFGQQARNLTSCVVVVSSTTSIRFATSWTTR
jgi:hypothetical protein